VVQYTLDVANKKLVDEQFIVAAPGSGPRYFAMSTELSVAYVVNELANTVTVHPLDANTGNRGAEVRQNISTLLKDYSDPAALASDVHVSSNGKFVYASTTTSRAIRSCRTSVLSSWRSSHVWRHASHHPRVQ